MGIENLITKEAGDEVSVVAVKLPTALVTTVREIRKETGKTNTEVYSALISEGLEAYGRMVEKPAPKKRGRKPKAKKAEDGNGSGE